MSPRPLISPLIPASPARSGGSAPSPLLAPPARAPQILYGLSTVDGGGRITGKALLQALGWPPGTRLSARAEGHALCLGRDSTGLIRVTGGHFLRVHYRQRRTIHLYPGAQALLAADITGNRLSIIPATKLTTLLEIPS